jgi:hypothetical protein
MESARTCAAPPSAATSRPKQKRSPLNVNQRWPLRRPR